MKKFPVVLFILAGLVFGSSLRAQNAGDYRTINSGNWDTVSIWQQYNGASWLTAIAPPNENAGVITVRSGHTVVSDRNRTADQLAVAAGGTLHLAVLSGTTELFLHDGAGVDLICNGHLIIDGNAVISEVPSTTGATIEYSADTLWHSGGIGPQFTFNGAAPQVIAGSGYMGAMTLDNSHNLEITGTTSFSSIQFVNGKINVTGTGILVVSQYGNGFTGQSNARFIDGKVVVIIYEKDVPLSFFLPMGKGSEYLPIDFTVTQDADVQTNIAFIITDGAPPSRTLPSSLESVSSVRYYSIDRGTSASNIINATIKFSYNANDGVNDPPHLHIVKSNGAEWVDLGGSASSNPNGTILSTTNFTTFGDFVLANGVGGANVNAQSLNYHFSAKAGTYTDLAGGTVAVLTADRATAEAQDDGYSNDLPIGFTFNFNGKDYETINVNSNGYAAFEKFIPISDSTLYDYWTNNLYIGPYSETNIRPILAPLWSDHDLFSDQGITYKTEGSAPNRVFTIQWDRVYWDLTVEGPNASISFQLKLYEGSNIIQFQYKPLSGPVAPGSAASIGITARGTKEGSFLSLNNTSNSPTASSTIETYTLDTKPEAGQIYQFSPIKIFYSKSTSDPGVDLTQLSGWGSNPDGSGNQPLNFTTYDQQFHLVNHTNDNAHVVIDLAAATGVINMGGQLNIGENIELATAGKLVIKSFAGSTGRIGPVPATSSITGNVTVERYITSNNNRAYRLITPSVLSSTSIFNNWQEGGQSKPSSGLDTAITYGTHITGSTAGANGFDATVTGQPSLFTYDQVSTPQKYDAIPNTDVNILSAINGYLLFERGDRNPAHLLSANSSSNALLRATGSVLFGDVNFLHQQGNGRFSLVTNPYPSPINWLTLYADSTTVDSANFENYYTFLDPNVGSRGGYVTVNVNGLRSVGNGSNSTLEIQAGEAFFVKAKAGKTDPTFTVKEAHKGRAADLDIFRTASQVVFRASLFYNDATRGRRIADGALALFDENGWPGVDGQDAVKFANFDESVAFARDGKLLSIESRPLIRKRDTLFLAVARLKVQQYEWEFRPSNFSNSSMKASLSDKFLKTATPIDLNNITRIYFNVTTDPSSASADRFSIIFGEASTLPIEITGIKAYQQAAGINVDWNTSTESNIEKYEVEKSMNGEHFVYAATVLSKGNNTTTGNSYTWFDATPFANGNYYRIKTISRSGSISYSAIVKVTIDNDKQIVGVYPNPIQGGVINLQLSNVQKGKYNLSILNYLGQQVYSAIINHTAGSVSYKLPIRTGLAQGIYQMRITGNGEAINHQILVGNK